MYLKYNPFLLPLQLASFPIVWRVGVHKMKRVGRFGGQHHHHITPQHVEVPSLTALTQFYLFQKFLLLDPLI